MLGLALTIPEVAVRARAAAGASDPNAGALAFALAAQSGLLVLMMEDI